MTYPGRVKNGTVVLDVPAMLPEGAKVMVAVLEAAKTLSDERPLWARVASIGASVPGADWKDMPEDASVNLDHYLYGAPKCEE